MFALKQQLEGLERLCNKVGILFTIHVVLITLVDLENKHEVAHKHILNLCKLNDSVQKFQQK
jgi:hypothetical protein